MSSIPTTIDKEVPAHCRDLCIPMQDGVLLMTDIWGTTDRPRPAVLERTPYGRRRTDQAERLAGSKRPMGRHEIATQFNEAGYIYVVQDCRGTGDSHGRFDKYLGEEQDTAATLSWLRQQPWCDGRVATIGFSYGAACQWPTIGTPHEPQAALIDCGGFFDGLDCGVRQGGAFMLKQATWAHAQAMRDARNAGDEKTLTDLRSQDVLDWLRRGPWVPGHSPLGAAPAHETNLASFWQNGEDGPFWDRPGLRTDRAKAADTNASVFFVTSWHDTSLRSTVDNHGLLSAGQLASDQALLLIGPWSHGDRWNTISGEVDFGSDALPEIGLGASWPEQRSIFIDAALNGKSQPYPPVRWFEMGGGSGRRIDSNIIDHGGAWRTDESWPPRDSSPYVLNLTASGLAHQPGAPHTRQFTSDPDDPVPTLGGAINSGAPVMEGGMWDQSPLDTRFDILRYESSPFSEDLVLAGPVSVLLHTSADVPDFDIAVKIIDIYPDGPALNLSDGIARMRYRLSRKTETLLRPGEVATLTVIANPVGARICRGHRLRLDVAASNFPCFDINPQTGDPQGVPGPRRRAQIGIHTGHDHPSQLHLWSIAP